MIRAHDLEKSGDLDAALAVWKSVPGATGQQAAVERLTYKLAQQAAAAKQWATATAYYDELLDTDIDQIPLRARLQTAGTRAAREAEAALEFTDALGFWQTVAKANPAAPQAAKGIERVLRKLLAAAQQANDRPLAAKYCAQLLDAVPSDEKARRKLGSFALKGARAAETRGDAEEAATFWNYLLKGEPDSALGRSSLERSLTQQARETQKSGDLEGAAALWLRVLEISPHSEPAKKNAERCLLKTARRFEDENEITKAGDHWRVLAQLVPTNDSALKGVLRTAA